MQRADAMAQRDAAVAARAFRRSLVHGEDHRIALAQGHDNTYVGPTDSNGNTIIRGGTIVGSHACGDATSVVGLIDTP